MRMIPDSPAARWLPSRFHFAFFKLVAYLVARTRQRRPREGAVLVIDHHQSAGETYLVGLAVLIIASIFASTPFMASMPSAAALLMGAVLAGTALQLLVIISGLTVGRLVQRWRANRSPDLTDANSAAMLSVLMAAALYLLQAEWWLTRAAAIAYILMFAANGLAALSLRLMGKRLQEFEQSMTG